jgi:hypothetical protein
VHKYYHLHQQLSFFLLLLLLLVFRFHSFINIVDLVCGSCLTTIIMFRRTQVWRSKCNFHYQNFFLWLLCTINSGSVRSSVREKIARKRPPSLFNILSNTH